MDESTEDRVCFLVNYLRKTKDSPVTQIKKIRETVDDIHEGLADLSGDDYYEHRDAHPPKGLKV